MMESFDCGTFEPVNQDLSTVDFLALSPCGRWTTFADQDGVVRLWDSSDDGIDNLLINRSLVDLVFSPSGLHVATASSRVIRTFNRHTMEPLTTLLLEVHPLETAYLRPGIVKTLAYAPSREQLTIGTIRGPIYL